MQFVDECCLELKAGDGGHGIVSWRREAHYPEGGPFGGDGGHGGDIILVGDANTSSLFDLRNKKIITAQNGANGQTKMATGASGHNVYIKVPLGTSVYDAQTNKLLCDILNNGQVEIICEGGKGGHGNAYFKSSTNKAPTLYENGDLGETKKIILKLKYIADVGLVGLPNAGKSTFLNMISDAKPKIANYQFTTLVPVLGVNKNQLHPLVFADIPGLIEGASKGKGLGHEFLKHIERCMILIHLVSASNFDTEDIIKSFQTINDELQAYSSELLNKKVFIVVNKCDLPEAENNFNLLKKFLKNQKIYFISTLKKDGLDELLTDIYQYYDQNMKAALKSDLKLKIVELKKQKEIDRTVKIQKINDHTWEIISPFMKYWTHKIPLKTNDNIIRYNQKMLSIGVEQKALEAGAKSKDVMLIYGNEFVID